MDPKTLFKKALEQATATVKCIETRHYKNPTPCTKWDCQKLLNHMLYELSWIPDLLAGKTVAQVGKKYAGDLLGKDHTKNWQKAADKAITSVNKVKSNKIVHLSYADVPAEQYITEVGTDLLIHSWDAAQSYLCSLIFDSELASAVHNFVVPREREYANSSLFANPIKVPASARIQTRVLAVVGRSEPNI